MVKTPYPHHPRPSCHALIVDDRDRLLLIQRGQPPYQGWWGLPGGAVELGETIAEALRREVREETGLEVTIGRFLGLKDAISHDEAGRVQYHYVILFYTATLLGGRVQAGDDAARAEWIHQEELPRRRPELVPGVDEIIRLAGYL